MQINRCPKCGRKPSVIELCILDYALVKLVNYVKPMKIGYEAECYDCGLHTGRCKTRAEAVAKWNEMTKGETK